jgi:hypothetical protein
MKRHTKRRTEAGDIRSVVRSERISGPRLHASNLRWQLRQRGLDVEPSADQIGREDADG